MFQCRSHADAVISVICLAGRLRLWKVPCEEHFHFTTALATTRLGGATQPAIATNSFNARFLGLCARLLEIYRQAVQPRFCARKKNGQMSGREDMPRGFEQAVKHAIGTSGAWHAGLTGLSSEAPSSRARTWSIFQLPGHQGN